jgi:hypothetical protein
MSEPKCPFSMIQASGACRCSHAQEVVRRGGSEYDCTDAAKQRQCVALVAHCNALALPALGYEDDLTLTPKSVYERVLLGGLHGLRGDASTDEPIDDIWPVVAAALERHGEVADIPPDAFVPAIEACQIRKRRRKGR